tara:strand:- start:1409 stop:3289 length:1881 start_codon:yes stop_codon:yes gene_type:complete
MHPLTGDQYRCQKRYTLYGALSLSPVLNGLPIATPYLTHTSCVADVAETDDDGNIKMKNLTRGSGSVFDPDPAEQAIKEEHGLCVDMDYSHQQGCRDATASAVMDGIIGCFDRQVSMFLCGLSLNIMNGDVGTATIEGNFFYENGGRVLVGAGQDLDGDGKSSPLLTCSDPSDCSTKCRMLERTSLHGAGAPPACALCDQYCSSNIVSTIMGLVDAIWADVLSISRLLGVCFGENGFAGCMCQLVDILQPKWRAVSSNQVVRCEHGDPLEMIVARLFEEIIKGAEEVVNDEVLPLLRNLPLLGGIDDVCIPLPTNLFRCVGGHGGGRNGFDCSDERNGLENMCYYERVMRICTDDDLLGDYDSLFVSGYKSLNETQAEFARAFGESYEIINPAAATLFQQLEASHGDGPDLTKRRNICSGSAFAQSMSLDMVIVSCVFAAMEKNCPQEDATTYAEQMDYEIGGIEFELDKVRWEYDVSPPPPPPATLHEYELLLAEDPHGFAMARAHLEEIFPRLEHVATSSMGATVGTYIADYDVSAEQLTKAFLASEGMPADSLGARVIQAKHTGRWRPACYELHQFLDSRRNAGAGSASKAETDGNPHYNDNSHNSVYDRNLLLYAMLEIKMS